MRRVAPLGLAAVVVLATGCATASDYTAQRSIDAVEPVATSVPTTTATTAPAVPCTEARASLSPSQLFAPGAMPTGSTMRTIQDRGKLIVGIDENTDGLAARDPMSGEIRGLEVDLVREIARAITGDPSDVVFKTVVTAEKNQVVRDGEVDLTASANSMSCDRWNLVSFSTEYFTATHKLMVRADSKINGTRDLAGHTVCVTAGSSSVKLLATIAPDAKAYEVPARTECLIALQNGDAEAYFGHDTFLRGMHDQDPKNTRILPEKVQQQHYGIAIAHRRADLVRFVNALLERLRADGSLERLADVWFGEDHLPVPAPMYQDGGAS